MRSSTSSSRGYRLVVASYLIVIFGVPSVLALGPICASSAGPMRLAAIAIAPALFAVTMPLVAGLLGRLTMDAVVAGKFDRDLSEPLYARRRLYGLCWTAIYYFPPIYHFVLTVPWMMGATFRLFGYRGSLDVTVYPDTWIRDLPLLDLARGVYLSNKATIGTNICMPGNKIIVGPITVGRNAIVGHLCMVAPGVTLGDAVELGVGSAVGLRSRIGPRSSIGPCAVIYHGVRIGADCHIAGGCLIGSKSIIADGMSIPFGTVLPPRSQIANQTDLEAASRQPGQAGVQELALAGTPSLFFNAPEE